LQKGIKDGHVSPISHWKVVQFAVTRRVPYELLAIPQTFRSWSQTPVLKRLEERHSHIKGSTVFTMYTILEGGTKQQHLINQVQNRPDEITDTYHTRAQ
jgi:hypothetical protein